MNILTNVYNRGSECCSKLYKAYDENQELVHSTLAIASFIAFAILRFPSKKIAMTEKCTPEFMALSTTVQRKMIQEHSRHHKLLTATLNSTLLNAYCARKKNTVKNFVKFLGKNHESITIVAVIAAAIIMTRADIDSHNIHDKINEMIKLARTKGMLDRIDGNAVPVSEFTEAMRFFNKENRMIKQAFSNLATVLSLVAIAKISHRAHSA